MNIYYVDFSGYCVVEANSADEAEAKFRKYVYDDVPLPHNSYHIKEVGEMIG